MVLGGEHSRLTHGQPYQSRLVEKNEKLFGGIALYVSSAWCDDDKSGVHLYLPCAERYIVHETGAKMAPP